MSCALLLTLLVAGSTSAATSTSDCSLTVTPRSGQPGTQFTIRGRGLNPDHVTLRRHDGATRTIPVASRGASFAVRVIADAPDAGRWRVSAGGCRQAAALRVSLPATSAAMSGAEPNIDRSLPILALASMGGLLLVSGVMLVRPGTRRVPSR
jgi:hypothetical protein